MESSTSHVAGQASPVFVLATSVGGTQQALRRGRAIAESRHAALELLVPVVTPYGPVPPCVDPAHPDVHTFRAIADAVVPGVPVHPCSCREPHHVLGLRLIEGATVVIGGLRGRWRLTPEERTARLLALEGHDVTFVDLEAP